jgi:hypothetical protein
LAHGGRGRGEIRAGGVDEFLVRRECLEELAVVALAHARVARGERDGEDDVAAVDDGVDADGISRDGGSTGG